MRSIKPKFLFFHLILCLIFSTTAITAQDSLTGVYDTGKENTKVEITQKEGVYSGKVASSDKVKPGTLMIKDVTNGSDGWKGKLYSFKKKKWYDVLLEKEDEALLVTVDAGIMKKTLKWDKE